MKINWKVRFGNKVFLFGFFSLIINFVYSMLALFDVFPKLSQNYLLDIVQQILTFLGLIGVIADPTTEGLLDSNRAMSYDSPWTDNE